MSRREKLHEFLHNVGNVVETCWNNGETKEEAEDDTMWWGWWGWWGVRCGCWWWRGGCYAEMQTAAVLEMDWHYHNHLCWRMKCGVWEIGRSSSSVTIWGITKRLRLAAAVMGKRHWCEHQCLWLFRGLLWRFVRSLLFRWWYRTNADTHHWASWENRKSCRSLVHRRPKSNDYVHRYVRYLHCLARSMKRSLPSGKAMSPTRTLQLLPCHLHRLACEATSDWDRHVG